MKPEISRYSSLKRLGEPEGRVMMECIKRVEIQERDMGRTKGAKGRWNEREMGRTSY